MPGETIDITPKFNLEKIQEYADRNFTRDPQTHLTAKLEVFAELADLIEQMEDDNTEEDRMLLALIDEIGKKHREASSELLGWFS